MLIFCLPRHPRGSGSIEMGCCVSDSTPVEEYWGWEEKVSNPFETG